MGATGHFLIILFTGIAVAGFLSWYISTSDRLLVALVPRGRELEKKQVEVANLRRELASVDFRLGALRDMQSQLSWREQKADMELHGLQEKAAAIGDVRQNLVYELGVLDGAATGLIVEFIGPENDYPFNGPGSTEHEPGRRRVEVLCWSHDGKPTYAALNRWRNLETQIGAIRPWSHPPMDAS